MTISVRLDPRTEALLDRLAQSRRRSKSDVIRESIRALADGQSGGAGATGATLYDRLKKYVGVVRTREPLLRGDWKARWAIELRARKLSHDPR